MFNVVLDTNIVLSSIYSKSPYHFILKQLFDGKFKLIVSTEILLEYEEKKSTIFSPKLSELFISALMLNSNVVKTETFFDLNLITQDADDNKFVNCAFAANAHFLVSNDKHFNVLRTIDFPQIKLLNIDEFVEVLRAN
ncbi:MAG: putative toxin-antitoxin system toxin component, PIN family [Bacteroidota bacterium]|nr:putative toxin-antitoxin system toxin component, PIN family [Bacteroidota bacterium]